MQYGSQIEAKHVTGATILQLTEHVARDTTLFTADRTRDWGYYITANRTRGKGYYIIYS